jgi:hypothetical protein
MGEWIFFSGCRPSGTTGFWPGEFASRKIVLEMLEASGKRVYSAREIQPARRLPRRMSGIHAAGMKHR